MTETPREHLVLAAVLGVGLACWPLPWLWPLRLLVVGFHELGHAALVVLTGGEVVAVVVAPDESGHVLSRGGWPLAILQGGYLGSVCGGLGLLWLGARARHPAPRLTLRSLGGFSLGYALIDLRSDVFGAPAGAVTDATLLAAQTGVPGPFWAVLWTAVGLGLAIALRERFL